MRCRIRFVNAKRGTCVSLQKGVRFSLYHGHGGTEVVIVAHDFDGGFAAISLIAPTAALAAPLVPVARAIAPAPSIVSDWHNANTEPTPTAPS